MGEKTPVEVLDCDPEYIESLTERFWEKVDRGASDECWEWTACRNRREYGQIRVDGTSRQAHRVAYALENEDPVESLVLHTCDNPPCVNPAHLYRGDHSDNVQDMWDRGRATPNDTLPEYTGEDHPRAKLTEDDVVEIRGRLRGDETQKEIAEGYGVTRQQISDIARGNRWQGVGVDQ